MLKKINFIFTKSQKKRLVLLLIIILIGTLLELLGVTAILPFMNIILNPNSIFSNKYWNAIYEFCRFETPSQFIMLFSVALIVIYVVKNLYISMMYNLQYRFVYNNQKRLASRMLDAYMKQPYLFHLSHNSAELMRNVNSDTTMFFQAVLGTIQLVTEICVCLVLVVFLMFTDKTITIGVAGFLSVFVLVFFKVFKKNLADTAERSRQYYAGMTKWLQQSFGGMKEIKVMSREHYFLENYVDNYSEYAEAQRQYMFMQIIPRPIMEAMCVSGLLLVVSFKLSLGVNSTYFISTLSVFAVAAFRMLPSFNRITNNLSIIMFNKVSVDAVYHDLKEIESIKSNQKEWTGTKEGMRLSKELCIKDLTFAYPGSDNDVLNKVSLNIPKNKAVAFIGPSGAGKTTLADIVLGVLKPNSGSVTVDGMDIFENLDAWHQTLGYIPQVIYLMDDTIRNNIAFGLPENEIDEKRIHNALKEAQLEEFVASLPEGVETVIGERGVRLSGGQRQRIGIARALYTNPDILVLDEATSALDNDTETAVMEAIDSLAGNKTLIIIAHRLTTIKNCELIFEVRDGNVTQKTSSEITSDTTQVDQPS